MDNCIVFEGRISKQGYGKVCLDGKDRFAHRIAWMWAHGGDPIPAGMFVCHKCDNPPCINPAHLFLGTPRDNVADMVAKGRNATGLSLPQTKLTAEQVMEIRAAYAVGVTQDELGQKYGVTGAYICVLLSGSKRGALPLHPVADKAAIVHANKSRRTAKLSHQQVREIRSAFHAGLASQTALAMRYGVHSSTVSRLVNGERWRIVK